MLLPAPRVLIANGQTLARAGFRALLERTGQVSVVGEATTSDEAVALTRRVRPDVVMLDTALAGLDCIEAVGRMVSQPGVAVMLMPAREDDDGILPALRAGATGVLSVDTHPVDLVRAIELLARGGSLLSPGITRRFVAEFTSRPEPLCPDSQLVEELTAREREVAALVALGLRNDEIAEQLVVSPTTAKTHVSRVMRKLSARSRAQLVVFAYEAGLVAA